MKKKMWLLLLAIAVMAATMLPLAALAQDASGGPSTDEWEANSSKTVYYNGSYYDKLATALTAVYMSKPTEAAVLYCRPDADVGTLTHGHVADDLIIYGNGAVVSGGEGDLEIDTYRFNRNTGKQDKDGIYLDKDITVKVYDLDGIAAWGQRNTAHTINLFFENCQNMDRVYFTNTNNRDGKINISLNNCSFDASKGSHRDTSVYSNAAGDITIKSTAFKGISVGLNINHKSAGTQNITLENCVFENCALKANAGNAKTYAAPVRVVSQVGATTNLTVKNAEFLSNGETCGNGDILLNDGRHDAPKNQGIVTLAMTDTQGNVMVQAAGYYAANGSVGDPSKAETTSVAQNETLKADTNSHFTIDRHDNVSIVGKKDATCTAEGYTGDKVCAVCGLLVEKGQTIPKLPHTFQDGQCTACGAADPSYVAPGQAASTPPKTGDDSHMTLWVALLVLSAVGTLGAAVYGKKRSYNQ